MNFFNMDDIQSLLDAAGVGMLPTYITSLAIGLLIGLERERYPHVKAGLRTIALTTLLGTLLSAISDVTQSPWLAAVGLIAVAAMIISAYHRPGEHAEDVGTTTIITVLVAYSLGVLTYFGYKNLAVSIAIGVTTLLYFKAEIRGLSTRFGRHDLFAILQFATLTFIVLPVLPDHGYGPYGALNPHRIWLMVVLVSGMSLVGYIMFKLLDQRHSTVLAGISGGLVSTTAVTMVFSKIGRAHPAMIPLAVRVILVANVMLPIRLLLLTLIVANKMFTPLAGILGLALAVSLLLTLLYHRKTAQTELPPPPDMENPAELSTALSFGAAFALVLFLAAWLTDVGGKFGLYLVSIGSGVTDVSAIALSSMHLFDLGNIPMAIAIVSIVIALCVNQIVKLGMVYSVGGKEMFKQCLLPMAATGVVSAIGAAALL